MDLIDWDVIDGTLELSENRDMLREMYPQFCWSKHDVKIGEGSVADLRKIGYDLEEAGEEPRFIKYVTIAAHKIKSKGKTYEKGRIQISTPPKFIGCMARVDVEIFVSKEKEESIPKDLEREFEEHFAEEQEEAEHIEKMAKGKNVENNGARISF